MTNQLNPVTYTAMPL